jgi:hypothetical protein
MRPGKTTRPVAGEAEKALKVAPVTEQLSLDFEARAPGKTPKVAAKAGAKTTARRQGCAMLLDITAKPKR